MKKVFYIIGDSWLSHHTACATASDNELFKDWFVINHSMPGAGNLDIINRVGIAQKDMESMGLSPVFCIALSEVGRGFLEEFKLCPPVSNLRDFLKSIMVKQIEILKSQLKNYPCYITTGWTSCPDDSAKIIDFIDDDFSEYQCYTVANGIYNWLNDRSNIFKFDKQSFVDTVEEKQKFEAQLLANPYINNTLHLDMATSLGVYNRFFTHVLEKLNYQ